ncbi:MAG: peptidoglycan bridge formation glycyltransferase FemA/FemB family protein [Lactovum sp.]
MKFQIQINAQQHDNFIKKHPLGNLLQSSDWAKVKDNWKSELISILDDRDEILASSLVLIKTLPLGYSMLYIPRGPILDFKDEKLLDFYLIELKKWAKTRKALFIKFDPNIIYETGKFKADMSKNSEAEQLINLLKRKGIKHSGFTMGVSDTIQPRVQANEALTEKIESIYPKHTRRLMKDAMMRGVKVSRVDESGLKEFSRLIDLTENRKSVSLRNFDYFQKLMSMYKEDAYLHLATVNVVEKQEELKKILIQIEKDLSETSEEQKKRLTRLTDQKRSTEKYIKELESFDSEAEDCVIAGILSIKFGETVEMLYAGMDEKFKKFYPQYLLYTLTFQESFEAGAHWANMGGIKGTLDDGLSKFKSNFNPDVQFLVGEFTLAVHPFLSSVGLWAYNKRKSSH